MPWAATWSFAASADYVIALLDSGSVDLFVSHSYRGETRCNGESQATRVCLPQASFPLGVAQNQTDARVGWRSAAGKWGVSLYGANLFDKRYVTGINNITASTFGTPIASVNAPRRYGIALFTTCTACHGAHGEGLPATGAPNIAGAEAWYVERQLRNFATGARGAQPGDTYGATMKAGSALLTSDRDRSTVASYVAALPQVRATAASSPVTDNGRNYFNAICSACHASNGLGNEALGAPRLAGLPAAYLARQLAAFKSGQRGAQNGDKLGAQMRAITAMLPDARTEQDVIAYAASLKP